MISRRDNKNDDNEYLVLISYFSIV